MKHIHIAEQQSPQPSPKLFSSNKTETQCPWTIAPHSFIDSFIHSPGSCSRLFLLVLKNANSCLFLLISITLLSICFMKIWAIYKTLKFMFLELKISHLSHSLIFPPPLQKEVCFPLCKVDPFTRVFSLLSSLSPLGLYYISFLVFIDSFLSALKHLQKSYITVKTSVKTCIKFLLFANYCDKCLKYTFSYNFHKPNELKILWGKLLLWGNWGFRHQITCPRPAS